MQLTTTTTDYASIAIIVVSTHDHRCLKPSVSLRRLAVAGALPNPHGHHVRQQPRSSWVTAAAPDDDVHAAKHDAAKHDAAKHDDALATADDTGTAGRDRLLLDSWVSQGNGDSSDHGRH